ncbi:MAG: hypothetical protein AAF773_13060 [Cyanobacteria bacterium P01_D01_bin.115]
MNLRTALVLEPSAWTWTKAQFPHGIQRSHFYQLVAQLRKCREDPQPHRDESLDHLDISMITAFGHHSPLYCLRDKGGALGVGVEMQIVFGLMARPARVLVLRVYDFFSEFPPSVIHSLCDEFEVLQGMKQLPALDLPTLIREK